MPMRPAAMTAQRRGGASAKRHRQAGPAEALGQGSQTRPQISLERARIALRIANGAANVVRRQRWRRQDSLQGPGQCERYGKRKVERTASSADGRTDRGQELIVRDQIGA